MHACVMLAHLGQPLLLVDRGARLDQRLGSTLLLLLLSALVAISTVVILVVILARAFVHVGRGRQDPPSVSPIGGACSCGG